MLLTNTLQRLTAACALCCALVAAVPVHAQSESEFGTARVTRILEQRMEELGGLSRTVQQVELLIEDGPDEGQTVTIENGVLPGRDDMTLAVGNRVVIERVTNADGTTEIQWRERYRLPNLLWLCAGFVALSVLLGRKTGVSALLGLVVSIAIIALFIVPQIAKGADPLVISLAGSTGIACTSLYLAHGFSRRTTIALLSTLASLTLSVLFAVIAVRFGHLFGMGSEESMFLQMGATSVVNLRGLLLGGIVIGCLGVLDDITTAQTAVVDELRKANPLMTSAQLLGSALSVGREHIASLINTLALAYAGAALPLLLLFQTQEPYPLWITLNNESIAEELVRTLVGSSTLLLAVPISTWFAVVFLKNAPITEGSSHGHHH